MSQLGDMLSKLVQLERSLQPLDNFSKLDFSRKKLF